MRTHSSPRAQRATADAMSGIETARNATRFRLTIGGEPVAPRTISYRAEDVRSADSIAMLLSVTLPGLWPDTTEGKVASVEMLVRDPESDYEAAWREFDGRVKTVDRQNDGTTAIEAYSPGEVLSRQKTGREVVWSGHTPQRAMHEAVRDAGYSRIDVTGVPLTPKLVHDEETTFEESASRGDLLGSIREKANSVFFDEPGFTGRGASLAALSVPPYAGSPEFNYVVGRDTRRGAFKPSPATDGRYSRVIVFRLREDGGRDVLRKINVRNGDVFVPPYVDFEIEVTDTSPGATTDALATGLEVARALFYGAWNYELSTLVPDPRILRGSHGTVEETTDELDETVKRRWMVVVAGYERDPRNRNTTLLGPAFKTFERRTPIQPIIVPDLSRPSSHVRPRDWGVNWRGVPYLDDSLPWVTDNGTSVTIDTEEAARNGVYAVDTGTGVLVSDDHDDASRVTVLGERTVEELGDRTIEELST